MDASWGAFLDILEDKAGCAGHRVIRVNPRFTSQKCHKCAEIVQKSLSVRSHVCPLCGYVADRDVNAAKNILSKARSWPSGTVSDGSPVELRSPALKRGGVVTPITLPSASDENRTIATLVVQVPETSYPLLPSSAVQCYSLMSQN